MTSNPASFRCHASSLKRFIQAASTLLLFAASPAQSAETATTGVVMGMVTNKATGNGLIGARAEIPTLKLSAFVDNTGRYLLNVPVGTHELVVTYTGLDPQRTTLTISAGQPAVRNFVMGSDVLKLDAFKVSAVKEGLSSALTQQRNADNLKNIASMDALADLPNMNATELAIRLPGVTFADPGDEVVETISVRGMGGNMTSITI
ncbi:MAG: TonB-dependent receptor, partial [Opitutus sp.]|nr:TonB-dependent receptor [Opitutus sp.]